MRCMQLALALTTLFLASGIDAGDAGEASTTNPSSLADRHSPALDQLMLERADEFPRRGPYLGADAMGFARGTADHRLTELTRAHELERAHLLGRIAALSQLLRSACPNLDSTAPTRAGSANGCGDETCTTTASMEAAIGAHEVHRSDFSGGQPSE